jgi:hypothetical protein
MVGTFAREVLSMNEVGESAVLRSAQVNLERWGVHVRAALAAGQSLRAYAREHGVSRHTLYAAQTLMRRRGELPALPPKAPRALSRSPGAFVPVAVRSGLSVTAQLPNGVRVQCEVGDDVALQRVLAHLAGLSCSD